MSSQSDAADQAKTEAGALRAFIVAILLTVVATVAAGFFWGLAGVGAVAIAATALMMVVLLLLTNG
jgi:hypothetical protein